MAEKPVCNLCGDHIIGTSETMSTTAYAEFRRGEKGEVEIEYLGESKLHWDTQKPDTDPGDESIMVECSNHHTIPMRDVVWLIDGCVVTDEEASET